jgi:predicted transcriptional regulator
MKLQDFFERLEKEFGLTPHDFCKIKAISYSTLKRYLSGRPPTRFAARKLEKATGNRVTLKEMGISEKG